jgi:hypothetical protein
MKKKHLSIWRIIGLMAQAQRAALTRKFEDE